MSNETHPPHVAQEPAPDTSAAADTERRLARNFALGLPLATLVVACTVGVISGVPAAILVCVAGALVGVVALFWASLRTLGGDAPLPEALDHARMLRAASTDGLVSKKKMLLRALKDLESERSIGKLDDEDFAEVAARYRAEIKDIMRVMDEMIAPYRSKAEDAAHAHLVARGLEPSAERAPANAPSAPPAIDVAATTPSTASAPPAAKDVTKEVGPKAASGEKAQPAAPALLGETRVSCEKCGASNERDAKFCKSCGGTLDDDDDDDAEGDSANA